MVLARPTFTRWKKGFFPRLRISVQLVVCPVWLSKIVLRNLSGTSIENSASLNWPDTTIAGACQRLMITVNQVSVRLQQLANLIRPDIEFKHYLFKSIETAYLQDYENRFPEMRFIHIMRDPVKVCSSQKRSIMENKSLPASYLGYDWLSCMLDKRWLPHARFLDERQNDARHFVVRYEDLIQNPGREINRMAEQLGVAAPERSTVQTIFHNLDKTSWGGNPSKKNVETPAEVVSDLQERHNYEEVLSPREIDLIAVKTRNLLEQFGYESPSSEATLAKLTFQYLLLDKWELVNWRSPRLILRGLFGILYRRIFLYK